MRISTRIQRFLYELLSYKSAAANVLSDPKKFTRLVTPGIITVGCPRNLMSLEDNQHRGYRRWSRAVLRTENRRLASLLDSEDSVEKGQEPPVLELN